jgi:hypothetical protein
MRYQIKHLMADTISVIQGPGTFSSSNSSEVAFFMKGEWVVAPIEQLAQYHDGSSQGADSAVYPYVPNSIIASFIKEHKV